MRKILRQFKSFALSGSMLDLALGFIIGTAFASVVTSATDNLLTPLISAIFGKANFGKLHGSINGTRITYGTFLEALLNFVLFAALLFFILKAITSIGLGRARIFEERQCPYCMEYVNPEAIVCKVCRQPLVDELPPLASAEARADKLRERRHIKIDLPSIELDFKDLSIPRRRRATATTTTTTQAVAVVPVIVQSTVDGSAVDGSAVDESVVGESEGRASDVD